MKLTGAYEIDAEPEVVWEHLLDASVLAGCIPGCRRFEEVSADVYEVELAFGVGPVSGDYRGTVVVRDKVEPHSLTMLIEGKSAMGDIKGKGTIVLSQHGVGTGLKLAGESAVSGLASLLADAMMSRAAQALTDRFFECLKSEIEGG